MRLEDAAQGLGLSPSEVRREMTELAPAGVIRPSHHERWVVYPSALRYALVRDVFFSTEPNLLPGPFIEGVTADRTLDGEVNDHDLQQLMELIPDVLEENRPHREVARTLIGTKRVGGRVPPQLLIRHLRDSKSNRAWAEWAGLGAYEARHALRERPTAILEHPEPFLYWITHEALANLLDAVSDRQSAPMHTGKRPPLEVVTNWIRRKWQPDEALHRRKMATAVAIEWGEAHPASDLDCQILGTVLSPGYECSTLDPGAGDTLTINSGILQDSVLQEIGALWSDSILPFLKTRPANNLRPVVRAVSSWKNLSHASLASPSSEKAKAAQTLATPMIADLLELTSGHPGLWHKIAKLAEDMGIEPGAPDWEYMLMYGPLDRSDVEGWEAADADRAEKARQLGKSRADSNPSTVTSKLASLEKSAKEAGDGWPRYTPQYAEALAEHSNTDPLEWVREFESASLPPDLVQPFLSQAHEPGTSRIWATIRNLIEKPQYEWLAIHTTITAIDAPSDLQKEALDRMVPYTKQLEWTVLRGELHPNTIRRLLQHEDDSVASTVAIEMWSRKHETPSDPEIASLWREGILRTPEDQGHEYNLGGILASDQDLAVEWLSSRLGTSSSSFLIERSPTTAAIDSLDEKSRVRLLSHLQTRYWAGEITAKIVGNSPAVYRALLEDESLKDLHLAPVAGHSKKDRMGLDDHWAARVKMALEHGYTSEQIADATFPISYVWSGSESQMWESWIEAFQTIPSDTPDVEMIKAIGISTAQERKQDALAGEHKRQVYGYTYAG